LRNSPRICAAIVKDDIEAIREIEPEIDLFEVRIDLIGNSWRELVGLLKKPWIACNRRREEGGSWPGGEKERVEELVGSIGLGAGIVDIELNTPGIETIVREIKGRAECLISYHDTDGTPFPEEMRRTIERQLAAGADICKLVTTARSFEDNLAVLNMITEFRKKRLVCFAMGEHGHVSRVMCPLVGGDFTYASIETGKESAPGQITVSHLKNIYGMMKNG